MKYYIICGEASGDLHASNLMKQIKLLDHEAEFRFWGGDLMEKQGGKIVRHYKELSFMGFWEVISNISVIIKNIEYCKKDILEYKPDALILVDYPGFNLRIAEFARKENLKIFYYISPQIWAWKQSRVKKIKRDVDKMLVVLPFEKDFYKKLDFEVEFVGHPLLDAIDDFKQNIISNEIFINKNNLNEKPIVALLPGSRKQEVSKILPIMLDLQSNFEDYQFVIAGTEAISKDFYYELIRNRDIKIIYNQTYQLLNHSYAALVKSGTGTLETALFEVPEVVCYKAVRTSYFIAKYLISFKLKFISLVNLIMNRKIVSELIQENYKNINLKNELGKILNDKECRENMIKEYKELRKNLGGIGASKRSAEIIIDYLRKN
ncbi:MAG: lipid-A-disaccharide synthase [Bacteroidales bacterium]|jgi:lipid-A-disaccharide synthase